jgi:RND superfamily putative drug exporter
MLSYAFTQLTQSGTWSRNLAEVGVMIPTAAGLEIFLCGGVTVALDDGTGVTLVEGRNRCLHQSVKAPAVAAVITVDELGRRPAAAPQHRNTGHSLPVGIVTGRGAVVWSAEAASAPRPGRPTPAAAESLSSVPTREVALPKRWVVLDDDSRIEIDRDCVIGRDPNGSSAVRQGLRPVSLHDTTGLMSRAHLEIRLVDGELVVVDRDSTNGVLIREPGQQVWKRLKPWQPTVFRPGASLQVGGRTLCVQSQTDDLPKPQHALAHAISV